MYREKAVKVNQARETGEALNPGRTAKDSYKDSCKDSL
jgi:hypothetical protein